MNTSSPLAAQVDRSVLALREAHPNVNISGEVVEGRVVDGVTIEVSGYFGGGPIEVKAATAEGATALMLGELERVRSERQSYLWPPRMGDAATEGP